MKTILDKINKAHEIEANKTELGTHQVHLALLDELKVYVKNGAKDAVDFKKRKDAILKNVAALQEVVKVVALNKDYGKKALSTAQKYKAQMDKLSKELGINLVGSEPDKLLSDLFMYAEDTQGDIDDALNAVRTLKV
jgi:hypothetical protein